MGQPTVLEAPQNIKSNVGLESTLIEQHSPLKHLVLYQSAGGLRKDPADDACSSLHPEKPLFSPRRELAPGGLRYLLSKAQLEKKTPKKLLFQRFIS